MEPATWMEPPEGESDTAEEIVSPSEAFQIGVPGVKQEFIWTSDVATVSESTRAEQPTDTNPFITRQPTQTHCASNDRVGKTAR